MSASRWSPTNASRSRVVDEQRVGGAVPGPGDDAQVAAAGADRARRRRARRRSLKGSDALADEVPEASLSAMTVSGTPWWRISACEKRRSASRALVVARAVGRRALEAAMRAPERAAIVAASPMWSRWWWVTSTSSRSSSRTPAPRRPASSAVSAASSRGPVSISVSGSPRQQPGVDRADVRERERDADGGVT